MMSRFLAGANICIAIILISADINCSSIPEILHKYTIGDSVILTGYISSSTYLSRSGNSDKEYFNTAYILRLEKSIDINDTSNPSKKYMSIGYIEIDNPYESRIHEFRGTRVKIKGILKTFSQHPGYYRQYSTPVKIEVLEAELND
jgi:hypothetical protein